MTKPILTKAYHERDDDRPYENIEVRTFEFYPNGLSKPAISGVNRQYYLEQIFNAAAKKHPEVSDLRKKEFPLGKDDHAIVLIPESNNAVDPYAVRVYLIVEDKRFDIGWVPQIISKLVSNNIKRINEGKIIRVHDQAYDKYFAVKVIFGYDEKQIVGRQRLSRDRLNGILKEISR